MSRRLRRRSRGTTLVEILIPLAVVLVGMLALFRTLGTAVTGSMTASRFSQAQQRAVLVMESIRTAPTAALTCLLGTAATSWISCETTCRAALGGLAKMDSCVFTSLSQANTFLQDGIDSNLQSYYVVGTASAPKPYSQLAAAGTDGRVIEIQVVVGWRDDNTTTGDPDHSVVLRSGVFQ